MKFVHAADIHLDSPLRALSFQDGAQIDRMRRATRDAFERLIDLCIEQQASFLILSGDLYDRDYPNMQVAVFLRNQLARLDSKGIRVVIKKGNHDADNRITSALELPGNTRILSDRKPETILFDDLPDRVALHGQSFMPGPVTENLALSYPLPLQGYFNIGVLHTSLAGNPDHDVYAPCKLEDLTTKGYDYWALGHIHKSEILCRSPWVVYPGNLQGRHSRETGPKGCILVEVEDNRVKSVDSVPLDVVRWHQIRIDLGGATRESELIEAIRSALTSAFRESDGRPGAVRLNLNGATPLHSAIESRPVRLRQTVLEIAGEIGGDDLWIEKIRDNTTSPTETLPSTRNEAEGDLIRIMRELLQEEGVRLFPFIKAELDPLRAKLPEELKDLPEFSPPDELLWMKEALARLEPRLVSRLSGERDAQ